MNQSDGVLPYYFRFWGGKFSHMLTGGCCWNNYTTLFIYFFLNEHAPPQVTVASLDGTFMFCSNIFKHKPNDAQNSQFLLNETGKALYSNCLWWNLLLNIHIMPIFFPP